MSYTELSESLQVAVGIKERAAKNYIKFMQTKGIIVRCEDNQKQFILGTEKSNSYMFTKTEHFDAWMERIMEQLDRLQRKINKLSDPKHIFEGERLFDNQEICHLLHVSKRTLLRYRSDGKLKYQFIHNKIYYKESDIHDFIRTCFESKSTKEESENKVEDSQ